ncbi:hypothetical protein [Mesorhizobium sp. 113-3-3]|uniref:hypothetical protein n=1 Tax=Mesorhizobium sp. 113-3-3 TaxID=2744516 RepID=UPI0019362D7A|nr:hypothetical protein [Mesorhizobium sp. 113-3-3]BCG83647.1 hypothetical protein MesoLj113b_71890 [Mesorhizobium sp. 113-3-3]
MAKKIGGKVKGGREHAEAEEVANPFVAHHENKTTTSDGFNDLSREILRRYELSQHPCSDRRISKTLSERKVALELMNERTHAASIFCPGGFADGTPETANADASIYRRAHP